MTQEPEPDWSTRLAQSIAGEVRRYRQARGLSAQQLAERCAYIGMPIQRSVLANLESGRRTTVTVAEVLVLAKALGVPPGALMFPVGTQPVVELLPGGFVEPLTAVNWLSGHTFFDDEVAENFYETPLGLLRRHADEAKSLARLLTRKRHARTELVEAQEKYEPFRQVHAELAKRSSALLDRINDIAARGQEAEDFGEFERYIAEHRAAVTESEPIQPLAHQVTYAQQRVDQLEEQVSLKESVVRSLREHMRAVKVLPPTLPKQLAYIDPSPEFGDLGDLVETDREAVEPPIQDIVSERQGFPSESDGAAESAASVTEEISGQDPSADRIKQALETLKPSLVREVADAVLKALKDEKPDSE